MFECMSVQQNEHENIRFINTDAGTALSSMTSVIYYTYFMRIESNITLPWSPSLLRSINAVSEKQENHIA